MAETKLDKKTLPTGVDPATLKYVGRAAKDQDDFGSDVGLADMACVNQFGEANNAKYYHAGVVQTPAGKFYVYLEWGRMKDGSLKSWNGRFNGQDFQFVDCGDEAGARTFFRKQCQSKNVKRLQKRTIAGVEIWTAKDGDDGYLVQDLATRVRGLPDAYTIKDSSGVQTKAAAAPTGAGPAIITAPKPTNAHPKVIELASALVGGVKTYTRAMAQAAGVTPTMASITKVRTQFIPAAMTRIGAVGQDINDQASDTDLQAISKAVAALVPRPIPRSGQTAAEAILSGANILSLQQDLDAFEASLGNEDFSTKTPVAQVDPDSMLNAQLRYLDPNTAEGKWVTATLQRMSNNRHGYLKGTIKVLNAFEITRPDRDAQFLRNVQAVAAKRQGRVSLRANLQPASRTDLGQHGDIYSQANVILTQHGTRSVNISPIMGTHFRLPHQLKGVPIAGANFGHGNYQATDYKKAVGYSSYERSAWGNGGGGISGRGAFMFLCDMIMGEPYRAPSTGSWTSPPNGCDSVFGVGGDRGHRLENDEHVVFDPHFVRLRYLIEFGF